MTSYGTRCTNNTSTKNTRDAGGVFLCYRRRNNSNKRRIQILITLASGNEVRLFKRPGDSELESDVPYSHDSCLRPPTKRRRMLRHRALELHTTYTQPWKEVYKERMKVGINWNHGKYKATVLEGHTDSVTCLQIYNNLLVTRYYDASIRLWNLDSESLVRTFLGHSAGIRALQFGGSKIVSGSLDATIEIWNWQTGQCVLTLSSHNDALVGLDLTGKILASSSMDKTIKIWNFEGKEAFILRGHKDGVNSISMDVTSRILISVSDDFTLRLWDLDTRQCIRVFKGHCGQVQQALFSPIETEYSHLLESSPFADRPTHHKLLSYSDQVMATAFLLVMSGAYLLHMF
ncbi:hypothetical protein FHL15_011351 [Xylaria flabelliformis]|uniref:Uncharacterized protein n=1 Tax=Xylaria flabelliformis TaxID=2512241 RepID=A0A553HIJ6_9PEZI|nr:hypothetical protein FHL15_011351 [Xylaria flabelliformis]